MGWDRQKPFVTEKPTAPALGRWLLAGVLAAIVSVLLFALHAVNKLGFLQSFSIWIVSVVPLVGWLLLFSIRGYVYGRALDHHAFLQEEAQHAEQEWQGWAERHMAVLASHTLLPDSITVPFILTHGTTALPSQNGLARRIDTPPRGKEREQQAIVMLLESLEPALNALPAELALNVTLLTDAKPQEYDTLREAWLSLWSPRPVPLTLSVTHSLPYTQLDAWLKTGHMQAELILVLQLRGGETYSDGLAAFLLVTDDVAQHSQLTETGRLLRPMSLDMTRVDEELALLMETQKLACGAGGILGDSQKPPPLTAKILTVGNNHGAHFTAEQVQLQEELTGLPGPFSAWLVAAFGLDFARYKKVPYLVFSLTSEHEVISTVSPGVSHEQVE